MMHKFTRALIGATVAACWATASQAAGNLVIYNWSDYMDPAVIETFEAETGIDVTYETYDSNAMLETKMLVGKSGYDIIVPSSVGTARLIQAGVLQKLDKSKLSNLKHIWPKIAAMIGQFDPGNEYLVPYNWWTFGILHNVDMVKARLGPDYPKSWDLLFGAEHSSKLKECGVLVVDSPHDVIGAAMIVQGLKPGSSERSHIEAARRRLSEIRPNLLNITTDGLTAAMSDGDACLGATWSGDAYWSIDAAKEADNGVNIDYFIPNEGTLLDFDGLAIPADADNIEEAHIFLNFLMRPDIAAQNANFINYGSANLAAQPFINPELINNPAIYPSGAIMEKLSTPVLQSPTAERLYTRTWSNFRTGQ